MICPFDGHLYAQLTINILTYWIFGLFLSTDSGSKMEINGQSWAFHDLNHSANGYDCSVSLLKSSLGAVGYTSLDII